MAARTKILRDGPIGRKEPLGLTGRLKPLHTPLALPSRLMGILCPVIEVAMLAMFDSRENLSLGRSVALEFVGDEHARHVRQPLEEFTEELLCGLLFAPTLDENVQNVVVIHRTPQVMALTVNR